MKTVSATGAHIGRTDRRLLHELQLDGRLSNTVLADRASVSESACLRHRRRLERDGIITGYAALVDPVRAGWRETVLVAITLRSEDDAHLSAFEEAIAEVEEVMDCYAVAGSVDYVLRVIARDSQHFALIQRERLSRLPGVDRIESRPVLREVLHRTEIPIRSGAG